MRAVIVISLLGHWACEGPNAPDVEVCRDAIHRLCIPDVCPSVVPLFTTDCQTTLETRTGCASDSFVFTSPTRARFIDCRIALLRAGQNPEVHPSCDDVTDIWDRCPDVVRFYGGKR